MKISIITVCFNAANTIKDCLESVINQSFTNIEYIVIDGGSTDGTLEILKANQSHINCLISEADNGMYDALNKGIKLAKGDIIGILHSDDIYADNQAIDKIVCQFENTNSDSVYGDLEYVSKNNLTKTIRYWKSGEYAYSKLKFGWMPPHPTFFVRSEIYQKFGDFNCDLKIASDYDLMMRFLGKHRITCSYLPFLLIKMRVGGASNRSFTNILQKMKDDMHAIRQNQIGGYYTLIFKNLRKISQFFKKHKQ